MSELIGWVLVWLNFGAASYWLYRFSSFLSSKRSNTDVMPGFDVMISVKYLLYFLMSAFCGGLCLMLLLK